MKLRIKFSKRNLKTFLTVLSALLVVLLIAVPAYRMYGIHYTKTDSLPRGFYKLTQVADGYRYQPWQIVEWCPDHNPIYTEASDRWHFETNAISGVLNSCKRDPLLKTIGAVPGDVVDITSTALYVNGKALVMRKSKDLEGRPLPEIAPGHFVVGPDQVWLISLYNPNSFDSRYFGPVAIHELRGMGRPYHVEATRAFCWSTIDYQTQCLGAAT